MAEVRGMPNTKASDQDSTTGHIHDGNNGCNVVDGVEICGETENLRDLFSELQQMYSTRLNRLDAIDSTTELKVRLLFTWVADLLEQNSSLVDAVHQLEKQAVHHVQYLEDQLEQVTAQPTLEDIDTCDIIETIRGLTAKAKKLGEEREPRNKDLAGEMYRLFLKEVEHPQIIEDIPKVTTEDPGVIRTEPETKKDDPEVAEEEAMHYGPDHHIWKYIPQPKIDASGNVYVPRFASWAEELINLPIDQFVFEQKLELNLLRKSYATAQDTLNRRLAAIHKLVEETTKLKYDIMMKTDKINRLIAKVKELERLQEEQNKPTTEERVAEQQKVLQEAWVRMDQLAKKRADLKREFKLRSKTAGQYAAGHPVVQPSHDSNNAEDITSNQPMESSNSSKQPPQQDSSSNNSQQPS